MMIVRIPMTRSKIRSNGKELRRRKKNYWIKALYLSNPACSVPIDRDRATYKAAQGTSVVG